MESLMNTLKGIAMVLIVIAGLALAFYLDFFAFVIAVASLLAFIKSYYGK